MPENTYSLRYYNIRKDCCRLKLGSACGEKIGVDDTISYLVTEPRGIKD